MNGQSRAPLRSSNDWPPHQDLTRQASVLKQNEDYPAALELRLELEELLAEASADEQARNSNWIAYLGAHTGRLELAERAARKTLLLYRTAHSEADATLATYTFMLAAVLATAGKFSEAVEYGEQGVVLFRATGHDHQFVENRCADVERMRSQEHGSYLDRS